MSTHKELAGRLRPGDIGWTKVRIDTKGQDGWCFCTPANHPEDVASGKVEGEWAEESQFFGLVVPLDSLSPPDGVGLTRYRMWAKIDWTVDPDVDPEGEWVRYEDAAAALAAEKARADQAEYALARFKEARANRPDYEVLWAEQVERAEAAEARCDTLAEALEELDAWSKAYPLSVFPEPDFAKARALLEAGGMTLDAISASNMRHVVNRVGEIARAALSTIPAKPATETKP